LQIAFSKQTFPPRFAKILKQIRVSSSRKTLACRTLK
jgi:hypothetical protein